ncbi:Hypothetical protein Deide_14210 [Deinococcus deserti VCD115]|uniref:Uncharacterized protein n=1 Tax=Deinococcus deserti (strain DSM 17065 / CIP 109153 / LMG 22923 / VCD115) TaxID=546414 RepID=C1CW01_DEIDV|nr:Hypothetical protein Deide_14210 [Deinococcus deserti VCD115]
MRVFSNKNVKKSGAVTEYAYYRRRGARASTTHFVRQGGTLWTLRRMRSITVIDPVGWVMFCKPMASPAFLQAAMARTAPNRPDHSPRIQELRGMMAQLVQRSVTHNLPDDVMMTALEPMRQELEMPERDMRLNLTLADAMRSYLPGLTSLEERRVALDTSKARLLIRLEGANHCSERLIFLVPTLTIFNIVVR